MFNLTWPSKCLWQWNKCIFYLSVSCTFSITQDPQYEKNDKHLRVWECDSDASTLWNSKRSPVVKYRREWRETEKINQNLAFLEETYNIYGSVTNISGLTDQDQIWPWHTDTERKETTDWGEKTGQIKGRHKKRGRRGSPCHITFWVWARLRGKRQQCLLECKSLFCNCSKL